VFEPFSQSSCLSGDNAKYVTSVLIDQWSAGIAGIYACIELNYFCWPRFVKRRDNTDMASQVKMLKREAEKRNAVTDPLATRFV